MQNNICLLRTIDRMQLAEKDDKTQAMLLRGYKKQWFVMCTAELEYLAVYGRASMAALRQLSTHGQKFDAESLYEPM